MKTTLTLRLVAAALAIGSALFFGGCSSTSEQEHSQLPWSRPASWEGGMPGMSGGSFGQQGRGSAF